MTERFRNDTPFELVIPRFRLRVFAGAMFEVPDEDQLTLANQPGLTLLSVLLAATGSGALAIITGTGARPAGALVVLDSPPAGSRGALAVVPT